MPWFSRHSTGRPPHPDVLTPAEWRVLEHVRAGGSNPRIAEELGVSVNTVKTQISSMLSKLELRDRRELAAMWLAIDFRAWQSLDEAGLTADAAAELMAEMLGPFRA